MSKVKFGSKLFNVVLEVMTHNEESRNNDTVLCWKVYERQTNIEELSARQFFTKLFDKRVSSFSSITRARRAVQQHYPDLRGVVYEKRHKQQNKYIKFVRDVPKERQLDIERQRIKTMEESENGSI